MGKITIRKNQAKLIKEIRKAKKITQGDLSKTLSVNKQSISNVERGLTGIPATWVKPLADAYKIPRIRFIEAFQADMVGDYKKRVEAK